jgi:hypothetical protein
MWQVLKYPLNPFSKEHRVLLTDLSSHECLARLSERLASNGSESGSAAGFRWEIGIRGSVGPSGFSVHPEPSARNRFQTEAVGRLTPTSEGTRITLEFGVARGAKLFAVAALALSGTISVALVLRWLRDPSSPWSSLSVPIAVFFPPFIYGYFAASRWLAREEGPFLVRLLRNLLEAREA